MWMTIGSLMITWIHKKNVNDKSKGQTKIKCFVTIYVYLVQNYVEIKLNEKFLIYILEFCLIYKNMHSHCLVSQKL